MMKEGQRGSREVGLPFNLAYVTSALRTTYIEQPQFFVLKIQKEVLKKHITS